MGRLFDGGVYFSLILPCVVDPNTLNLDPDPEFWANLDPVPGPDPGLYNVQSIMKEKNTK